jgi:superfamily II RNA helicase
MFVTSNEGLHKKINDKSVSADLRRSMNTCLTIQDSNGAFNAKTYSDVSNMLTIMEKHRVHPTNHFVLNSLIEHLKGTDGSEGSHRPSMLPAIVFVFSRRLVEQYAEEITVPLFNDRDGSLIDIPYHKIRHECMTIIRRLPNWQEYAVLPEYISLVNLLEKGIGIHHSGMLPVLREIVELMISKKYIRVLFATESFAIGLDCPIKTAVFVSLKKHDKSGPRYLMAHEYTQMAGRAGRRGIDTVGNVVHCVNMFGEFPIQSTYKEVLSGIPQHLESKFKIDYKMVLNILGQTPDSTHLNQNICDFVKGSMMSMELDKMEIGVEKAIANLETEISLFEFTVPIEEIKTYAKMQKLRTMSSNKKLKDIERDSKKMVDTYPNLIANVAKYETMQNMESALCEKRDTARSIKTFIENSVMHILEMFRQTDIVDDAMQLTKKGEICTSIAEVNPVLMCLLFEQFNDFAEFDAHTLAAFLSVFADVKSAKDFEYIENYVLHAISKQFYDVCDKIVECEDANGIIETLNISEYSFAIADNVLEWCACSDENDCRGVLQGLRDEKGVSIGDFTKALLKISTVVRELISVCEKTGKMELMSCLKQIDPLILKHVTTNQSLYL